MNAQSINKPAKIPSRLWLFPLAALYAVLLLPLSVLGMLGQAQFLPALLAAHLANPYFHAHELIFGFAFPIISGYLLGGVARDRLVLLVVCWALARASFWGMSFHPVPALFSALAAGLLCWNAVPAFWRAKKWQNQSVAVIALLFGLVTALAASRIGLFIWLLPNVLLLLSTLMFFMGGRIITPLLSSYWLQRGQRVGHNTQPRVESAGLIALGLGLLLQASGVVPGLKGIVLLLAGGIILLRILRWKAWRYRQLDIIWLFLGYLGLAASVILFGLQEFLPGLRLYSTHVLTLAAMGLLMVSVMARINLIKAFKDPGALTATHVASGLMLLAAGARIAAPLYTDFYKPLLHFAILGWCLSFATLLWILWRCWKESQTVT
jgi:uncharacterized protein involved in response to NO